MLASHQLAYVNRDPGSDLEDRHYQFGKMVLNTIGYVLFICLFVYAMTVSQTFNYYLLRQLKLTVHFCECSLEWLKSPIHIALKI